jgi:molybdate transport system substrate-binding protein
MLMVADTRRKKFLMKVGLGTLAAVGSLLSGSRPPLHAQAPKTTTPQVVQSARSPGEIVVFAAASLTEPFSEIGKQLERRHSDMKIVYNFGGSSALRMQLEQGAHADVFASADAIQMEKAKQGSLIQGEARVFAANRLVAIVPVAKANHFKTFCDLGKPGIKLDLANANVPVGNYSRQAIAKAKSACGADFEQRVLKNLVSEEESVKQVVTKVQLGEADAGIVYVSDITAKLNNEVQTIPLDEEYNQIASYPIARTASTKNNTVADTFIAFVLSPEGQVILGGYGFMPVSEKKTVQESEE